MNLMYLLFAGANYYPSGGWNDFCGSFETTDDAERIAREGGHSWWHIVWGNEIVREGSNRDHIFR